VWQQGGNRLNYNCSDNNKNCLVIPATVQTNELTGDASEGSVATEVVTTGGSTAAGVPSRFVLGQKTVRGQTVVSDITSLAEEQARSCLLSQCITKEVFPYYKFVLLDSELDYGGRLQRRICGKLNVTHDPGGYWENNREKVRTKLTRKRNNVTEAIRKKMTGKCGDKNCWCFNLSFIDSNSVVFNQLYIGKII
jgi:hypothetical protein